MRWLALLLLSIGCGDDPAPPTVSVRVISPSGGDPLDEATFSTVSIEISQDGRPTTFVSEMVGGGFDLPIAINSLALNTRVRVQLEGVETWLGAPPEFVPGTSGGLVRIVVGPAGKCAVITDAELQFPREEWGTTRIETFALFVAGRDASGPSRKVEFLDLLRFFPGELDPLELGGGPTLAVHLGDAKAAVLSAEGSLIYDLGSEVREVTLDGLHAGTSTNTSAVERAVGATLVGGDDVTEATWIEDTGRTFQRDVLTSRVRPTGAAFMSTEAEVVLIVGGAAAGDPVAEVVSPSAAPISVSHDDGIREAAIVGRDGDALWVLGGTDADGTPRRDTVAILGCPTACTASVGPEWADAVPTAVLEDHVLAGDRVYRVNFDAGVWQREELWTLNFVRDGALLMELESGVVIVAGGEDAAGARADVEVCWPEELRAL